MAHRHDQEDRSQHRHVHEPATTLGRSMAWAIVLNLAFVVIEFVAGRIAESVALVSDAAHNLGDAAGLLLAWVAIRMAQRKPTARYTYGYARSTILASLLNAGLLIGASVALGVEAVEKLLHPSPTDSGIVIWTAAIGILINVGSARLLHGSHDHDLNVRGAYLHLLADAAVSLAVVVSGLLTMYTGLAWIDPAASLIVTTAILITAWKLLREGLLLSLDAVPSGFDVEVLCREAKKVPHVLGMHHVHVWPLSTTGTALTGHVLVEAGLGQVEIAKLKEELRHRLYHMGISHATLETEMPGDPLHDHSEGEAHLHPH